MIEKKISAIGFIPASRTRRGQWPGSQPELALPTVQVVHVPAQPLGRDLQVGEHA